MYACSFQYCYEKHKVTDEWLYVAWVACAFVMTSYASGLFQGKMAVSPEKDLHEFALEESCCPVCLEEFKEPKSLPNCLHNVCEKCLKSMTNGKANISTTIVCPVCRKKSQLPVGGVSAMPTNRLLVRLVEKTAKNQIKLGSRPSLQGTRRTLQTTKSKFEGLEQAYSRLCATKAEISSKAEKLVDIIKEHEKKLHAKVDTIVEGLDEAWPRAKRKEMNESLQQFINHLDNIEQSGSASGSEGAMGFSQAMLIQLEEYNKIFALHGSEGMACQARFHYNSKVESFLKETIFGELTFDAEKPLEAETSESSASCSQGDQSTGRSQGAQCTSAGRLASLPVYGCIRSSSQGSKGTSVSFQVGQGASGCTKGGNQERYNPKKFGTVVKTIFSEDAGVDSFTPIGLAVSNSMQEIAVLTDENRVFFIWEEDLSPKWFFNILYGELFDLDYSADDEIVVVNREDNRLLHYDGNNGTFIRKFVNGDFQGSFAGLSVDDFGRFIVCCSPEEDDWYSDSEASVLVFDENRRLEFSFGEGKLSDPEKALFYNEEFFVNDTKDIKVFDSSGRYKCKFGKFKSARGLAINSTGRGSTHILVCDEETDSVKMFKQNGKFVAQCHTHNRPRSVTVTASDLIAVACEQGECVQFISYPSNEL